jgi:hypothetical protein
MHWHNSPQCLPQHSPKRLSSEPYGSTRQQQAIANTPAKRSARQILTLIVLFGIIVFKV